MTDQRDILMSKIAELEADDQDFEQFIAVAEHSPTAWRELIETIRDRAALDRLAATAGDRAERIDIDAMDDARVPVVSGTTARTHGHLLASIGRWSGWAVAAALVLAFVLDARSGPTSSATTGSPHPMPQQAGIGPSVSAREAFDHYLERGRAEGTVLSSTPQRVLLDTRPAPSGEGYELIYLQQVLERDVVPELYHYGGQDEHGRPALVSYDRPPRPSM
jgi:hypothetical protein